MTDLNLFDALEICLQILDKGGDLESCLVRFPQFADELRPILMAAVRARSISTPTVPVAVARRNKARVMQAAAKMREERVRPPLLPFWRRKGFFGARFARLAVSFFAVVIFLLTGGTGLVNASSSALPGDHLYPVKRSWEGLRLFFVFDTHARNELEEEFDHERVEEIEELYSEKRVAEVNFVGSVQAQENSLWTIGGLHVAIEEETLLAPNIFPGSTVQVIGETDDGRIKARRILLVATPGVTPGASFTSSPVFTRGPESTEASEGHDGGETEDDGALPTLTASPTEDDSTGGVWTSTPRPGDDSETDDNSSSDNTQPAPQPTTVQHDGGDHEEDGQHKSTPHPTESEHENHGDSTPEPTEDHD